MASYLPTLTCIKVKGIRKVHSPVCSLGNEEVHTVLRQGGGGRGSLTIYHLTQPCTAGGSLSRHSLFAPIGASHPSPIVPFPPSTSPSSHHLASLPVIGLSLTPSSPPLTIWKAW